MWNLWFFTPLQLELKTGAAQVSKQRHKEIHERLQEMTQRVIPSWLTLPSKHATPALLAHHTVLFPQAAELRIPTTAGPTTEDAGASEVRVELRRVQQEIDRCQVSARCCVGISHTAHHAQP